MENNNKTPRPLYARNEFNSKCKELHFNSRIINDIMTNMFIYDSTFRNQVLNIYTGRTSI